MGPSNRYVGIDLGASSGRAVLGTLDSGRIALEDIRRFPNGPVPLAGTLYWDVLFLWRNVLEALRVCAARGSGRLAGIGIDTWGIDFGLIGRDGKLLGNPVCYRDERTVGMDQRIRERLSEEEFYSLTGMTLARFATLPQLMAFVAGGGMGRPGQGDVFDPVETVLCMPDLFRYFLCGARSSELSILTSTLLLDVRSREYCDRILDTFGIPRRILPAIARIGTVAGPLSRAVLAETGLEQAPVMVTAGHDTLAAVAAIPEVGEDRLFVSSGTWSVVGVVRKEPVCTPAALKAGFVNELGVDCVILARNLMGFYLLENLRDSWKGAGEAMGWDQVVRSAAEAKPFGVILDMDDAAFFAPENPENAVREFLRRTGQGESPDRGVIARAQYEGLAMSFRRTLEDIHSLTRQEITGISIVGGGSRNALLCQLIADATGLEVTAGPAEATVIGNIGVQAVAAGQLSGFEEIRGLAARSFPPALYRPKTSKGWESAYQRYREISG